MQHSEYRKISQTLKQALKAKGFTHETLAQRLGMSASGLKKLLGAKDCSLNKLHSICTVLGLEITELLKSSRELKSTEIRFTQAQEEFFLKNPGHFFFFWELIDNGMSLARLRSTYGLDEKSLRKYLSALEKLGLIELHPGDKVKHKFGGNTHWNMVDSLIGQKAMVEFQDGFLRRLRAPDPLSKKPRVLRWVNFSLRQSTYDELVRASQELAREFIARAHREKPLSRAEDLMPVGLLLGLMEFRYPDILRIPNIRA